MKKAVKINRIFHIDVTEKHFELSPQDTTPKKIHHISIFIYSVKMLTSFLCLYVSSSN